MANPTIYASRFRVKFKDVFDMKRLYALLREWLKEHGWADIKGDGEHYETLYLQKEDKKGAKEIYMWWRLGRFPVKNSYYKYILNVDYHTITLTDKEIVYEGKKLKVNKGTIEVRIRTYIELDYEGKWSSHPVLNFFKDIFRERIYKKDLEIKI